MIPLKRRNEKFMPDERRRPTRQVGATTEGLDAQRSLFPPSGLLGVILALQHKASTHLWDTDQSHAALTAPQGLAKMADGRAINLQQQNDEVWATAFKAKFDEICQRFWDRIEAGCPRPAPVPASRAMSQCTPLKPQTGHPNKALPPRERAQDTETRRTKQRPGITRTKWPRKGRAKASQKLAGGSYRPSTTKQGPNRPQPAGHHHWTKRPPTSSAQCTASPAGTGLKGRDTQPPDTHLAKNNSLPQPGPEKPQQTSTCRYGAHLLQPMPQTALGGTDTPPEYMWFLPRAGVR
ncbi:Hypothetical predicted protein [Pelobates cultripes]|uniref:Uncharacterized protein n=1 Tax=Pelobates cultripes TaxID=61616 RepID=A0AAD1W3F0_PELCU|nr:Hypothetical predicted protein [Pelobates cultripes]